MKPVFLFLFASLTTLCVAQQPAATPKSDSGLGHGSLDQRPSHAKIATPPPYVSSLPPKGVSSVGAVSTGLTFDAKTVANGGTSKTVSPNGSSTRISHPTIELNVRNLATQPANAHFDWYFVATDLNGRGRYVWDQGERDLSLVGTGSTREMLESTGVAQQTTNKTTATQYVYTDGSGGYVGYNSTQQRTGSRPDGWIVRMFVGGTLVRVEASTNVYEQIGRDQAQLDALLKKNTQNTPGSVRLPGRP